MTLKQINREAENKHGVTLPPMNWNAGKDGSK